MEYICMFYLIYIEPVGYQQPTTILFAKYIKIIFLQIGELILCSEIIIFFIIGIIFLMSINYILNFQVKVAKIKEIDCPRPVLIL